MSEQQQDVRWFTLPRGGEFSLPAEWWTVSGMDRFERRSSAYVFAQGPNVSLVELRDILPQKMDGRRHLTFGGFDRTRMIEVLTGIASGATMPPVPVAERHVDGYPYVLCDGTHRFYASVAAGFSQLPTVPGWIPETEALNRTPRFSAACHEVGHALVALSLGLPVRTLRVGIDEDDLAGRAEIGDADDLPLLDQLALCLAGMEAQELAHCGIHEFGGISDYVRFTNLLDERDIPESQWPGLRQAGFQRARELLEPKLVQLVSLAGVLAAKGELDGPSLRALIVSEDGPR